MLVPKEKVIEAKEKLGQEAAQIIAKDLNVKEWDEQKLKGLCPFHDEDSGSFLWNDKNQSFHCFGCQKNYGIIDHYMSFDGLSYLEAVEKLFQKTKTDFRFSERGVKTVKEYKYPKPEFSKDRSKVEEYWATRKISKETLDFCDVQQDAHGNTVFHYYDTNDVLCNVKYRPSRVVDAKKENKFWAQPNADTQPILYGMNKIDTLSPLVICEGEPDRLAIIESGYRNCCSIPFGAGTMTWIAHNWDWLDQFEKIVVFFDNDEAGVKGRKEVVARLGTWRTLFVDLPQSLEIDGKKSKVKDANEVLFHFGKQAVIDLIANAQETPVLNVLDLSEQDEFDIEACQGLYSGLDGLDKIIYKFIFGSVVLLTGVKGSGKSTFLNQTFICEGLNQGYDTFIFSGELSNPMLKNWVETTMAGRERIKMKNDFVRIIDPQTKKEMREWYKGRIWTFDGSTNDAEVILDRAINVTRRFGVKIWVLDNLMTLDIGATGEGNLYLKQKEFIVKLATLAKTYNILIVLITHPRKTSEIRRLVADDVAGSNDLGNMAQYILGVHRFSKSERQGEKDKKGGYRPGKEPIDEDVAIDVFKNRPTGRIGEVRFFFDYPSMRFYKTMNEIWKRYKWNKDTSSIPKTDPNNHKEEPDWAKD